MSRPEDNVQSSSDVLDAADPRAQAFAEHDADAARNSIDEVLDNWAQRVSPRIPPGEMGMPLPGDAAATPPSDRSVENILGCPTITKDGSAYLQGYASAQSDSLIKDNKVYLQGYVSVESDASENTGSTLRGVQSVEDLEQVGIGVARGLTNAGQDYLEFLSQPDAVNNAFAHTAETVVAAVNHYNARPDEIIPDAQMAGEQIGQALVDKLGHPLTPEQTGELAGEMMTVFIPIGRARALTDGEIEALGGAQKLEAMSAGVGIVPKSDIEAKTGLLDTTDASKLEKVSSELLDAMRKHNRDIVFAQPGSDEMHYLKSIGAPGSSDGINDILLIENAPRITAFEEFLHGTQAKYVPEMPREIAEVRVKKFMIKHSNMLGLNSTEADYLEALKAREYAYALKRGFTRYEIESEIW